MFRLSSDDPGPWDPAAVEPSICSSVDQDLAEPATFDAEAACVSDLHTRAVMALKFSSISVSRLAKSPSVFEESKNLSDLRFEVYEPREKGIEFFV